MRRGVVALALVVLAAGCGGGSTETGTGTGASGAETLLVQLQEQNFSGEAGTVTLTAESERTRVAIVMASYARNPQPAHIHRGTCAKLDPTPAYPLNNVVRGKSTTVVDASLGELKKGYAINMHRSTTNLKTYVACGNISEEAAPAETITTSEEEGGY